MIHEAPVAKDRDFVKKRSSDMNLLCPLLILLSLKSTCEAAPDKKRDLKGIVHIIGIQKPLPSKVSPHSSPLTLAK